MLEFINIDKEKSIIPDSAIEEFENRIFDKGIPFHGYMFLQGKEIVAEKYFEGYTRDSLHRMYSITKSFVAVAIGILIKQGRLNYEDKIVDYFPEMLEKEVHPWLVEMTIEDMLSMRTCYGDTTYKHKEFFNGDWTKSFFKVTPDHIPGTVFNYDTSSAHTLGALVEKMTHMSVLDFLRKELLDELGFSKDAYIIKDPVGVSQGGSGMMSTMMDVAKVAYVLNHKGMVDGKELLSSDFVESATKFQVPTCLQPTIDERQGYGYMIWKTRRPGFVLYGMGGQLAVCFPEYDFIYLTMADTIGNGAGLQIIYDCFYDTIYPYLEKHYGKVEKKISNEKSELAKKNGKADYIFYENKLGFEKLELDFESNKFELETEQQNFIFKIKENEWVEQIFPGTTYKCKCKASWENKQMILQTYVCDEEQGHISFIIGWKDDTRISIRVNSTNEPFLCGLKGFASAEIK